MKYETVGHEHYVITLTVKKFRWFLFGWFFWADWGISEIGTLREEVWEGWEGWRESGDERGERVGGKWERMIQKEREMQREFEDLFEKSQDHVQKLIREWDR